MAPVEVEESLHSLSDAISYHDIHTLLPVHGILGFYEFQEDLIEDLLPHLHKLMEQFGFEGGGTHSSAYPEPVYRVMEVHRRPYTKIHHYQHRLTNDLYETNPT